MNINEITAEIQKPADERDYSAISAAIYEVKKIGYSPYQLKQKTDAELLAIVNGDAAAPKVISEEEKADNARQLGAAQRLAALDARTSGIAKTTAEYDSEYDAANRA